MTESRRSRIGRGGIALALLLLLVWTLGRLLDDNDQVSGDGQLLAPRYQIDHARWTRFDAEGQARISVRTESIIWFDDASAQLENLELTAPPALPLWQLHAPRASLAAGSSEVLLHGPVSGKGMWPDQQAADIDAPSLVVNWQSSVLEARDGIVLSSPGRSTRANTLIADWTARSVQLDGDVRVRYVFP